ncbi:hypothetical protein WA026_015388 [Henosepilachna vigintioctopunctata]|uniref:Uncharacterized protein n=1 Tax=Henosepilachna vigintioctopunctata TaxID=420089 RepID=A0AAW1UP93_9CUCU
MNVKIDQKNGSITLDQSHYIDQLLQRFQMLDCKPVNTPMEPGVTYLEMKFVIDSFLISHFQIANGPIFWESKRPKTVVTEAEYMATAEAAKEGIYLKNRIFELLPQFLLTYITQQTLVRLVVAEEINILNNRQVLSEWNTNGNPIKFGTEVLLINENTLPLKVALREVTKMYTDVDS